jgi:hypothetical protein
LCPDIPVSEEYEAGAQFTGGNIEKVLVDLAGSSRARGYKIFLSLKI